MSLPLNPFATKPATKDVQYDTPKNGLWRNITNVTMKQIQNGKPSDDKQLIVDGQTMSLICVHARMVDHYTEDNSKISFMIEDGTTSAPLQVNKWYSSQEPDVTIRQHERIKIFEKLLICLYYIVFLIKRTKQHSSNTEPNHRITKWVNGLK